MDVADGSQLWGEQYNRSLSDVLTIQQEISREISDRLRLRITGEEQHRITRHSTRHTEAYQLYLKGRYHWNKRTDEGARRAIEYFLQAIEKDPSCRKAYLFTRKVVAAMSGNEVLRRSTMFIASELR